MAHAISIRANGFAEMAFMGETPWHGLGQSLQPGATLEEWEKAAGFDWRIQRAKVRFNVEKPAQGMDATESPILHTWDERHILFRSDTKKPLSVVSDGYKIVQPRRVLEFFQSVAEENRITLETAGVLHGGRMYWALAKLGPEFAIAGVDRIKSYAMLATSCDGSISTTAKFCDTRVVCANTVAMALGEYGKAIKVKHSTHFDSQKIQLEMGLVEKRWEEVQSNAVKLARTRMTKQAALETLIRCIGDEEAFLKAREERKSFANALAAQPGARVMGEIIGLFDGKARGSDSITSQGTAWGLLNAATEYFDHFAGRGDDSRLASTWFGVNEGRKQAILADLLTVADAA